MNGLLEGGGADVDPSVSASPLDPPALKRVCPGVGDQILATELPIHQRFSAQQRSTKQSHAALERLRQQDEQRPA